MKGWVKNSGWIDIIWELEKMQVGRFSEARTVVQLQPLDMYRVHQFQQ